MGKLIYRCIDNSCLACFNIMRFYRFLTIDRNTMRGFMGHWASFMIFVLMTGMKMIIKRKRWRFLFVWSHKLVAPVFMWDCELFFIFLMLIMEARQSKYWLHAQMKMKWKWLGLMCYLVIATNWDIRLDGPLDSQLRAL